MHSYSIRKLVSLTVLSVRIVPKCRTTVYTMLNIIVGCLSPAFMKIIRLEKPCMNVFPDFSQVQDPRGIIISSTLRSWLSSVTPQAVISVDFWPYTWCCAQKHVPCRQFCTPLPFTSRTRLSASLLRSIPFLGLRLIFRSNIRFRYLSSLLCLAYF